MTYRRLAVICLLLLLGIGPAFGAGVILNEYNAVDSVEYLGGGTLAADESGGRAADSFFGRVIGNGGDWFELVVITDHLDMRNWQLEIFEDGVLDETLDLTNHPVWSDLRSGTLITVAEELPSDISYNPAAGDWWIHVQANNDADGDYIEASNFPVSSSNWQLRIRNAGGTIVFGPAGEGISPASGVGGTEIFRLEADPSASIAATSPDYDDASSRSTFGSPNEWGRQEMAALRNISFPPSTLTVLSPNGGEAIPAGQVAEIAWNWTGTIDRVRIDFSVDDGLTWTPVYPPNPDNTGSYAWLVPLVESQAAQIRVSHAGNPGVYDISNTDFTVYECGLNGDITGDCEVDLDDLAALAAAWLECAGPNCIP